MILLIEDIQFGIMPGCGTTDTIFMRQIQEAYIRKNQNLYFALVDLAKALDKVQRKILWWSLWKVSVPEWIVHVMQVMYKNSRGQVRVNNLFSDVFDVQVGVHQSSALSPLLFIIVLEALSCKFHTNCLGNFYMLMTLYCLLRLWMNYFGNWKKHLEAKGLRVNMGKTKIMIRGKNLHSPKEASLWCLSKRCWK